MLRWLLAALLALTLLDLPFTSPPSRWATALASLAAIVSANLALARLARDLPLRGRLVAALAALDLAAVALAARAAGSGDVERHLLFVLVVSQTAVVSRVPVTLAVSALALVAYTASRGAEALPGSGRWLEFFGRASLFGIAGGFAAGIASTLRRTEERVGEIESYAQEVTRQVDTISSKLLNLLHYSESILDSVPVGVVVTDLDGRVTTFNAEAERLTGLSRESVLRTQITRWPVLEPLVRLRTRLLAAKEPLAQQEVELTVKKRRLILDAHLTMLVSRRLTEITGAVIVFRDVTSLRAMELKIRHVDRLAALGELSSMIAHEIRNPLNTIRGFSQRLHRKLGERPEHAPLSEDAGLVVAEVDRLSAIVTDMLAYARPERRHAEPLALADLVSECHRLIEARLGETKIQFRADLHADLPSVLADRGQLKQVFLNLFLNAVAATEPGGTLLVTAEVVSGGDAAPPQAVDVHVADSGSGIPGEALARVFDPFFTTKTTGTGLGLAIVKSIVESHGGTISAESAVGVGTTFTVRLPVAAAPPPPAMG